MPNRVNCRSFALMMQYLMGDEPRTKRDICAHTGLHWQTVHKYITELKKKNVIYISGWVRIHRLGVPSEAYNVGNKKTAPRPPRISAAESMRNTRRRRRLLENRWKGLNSASTDIGAGGVDGDDVENRDQTARVEQHREGRDEEQKGLLGLGHVPGHPVRTEDPRR